VSERHDRFGLRFVLVQALVPFHTGLPKVNRKNSYGQIRRH
ncbi:MAG: hypothetical protein ACI814_003539, partial [Mariniblastus sp.]